MKDIMLYSPLTCCLIGPADVDERLFPLGLGFAGIVEVRGQCFWELELMSWMRGTTLCPLLN
jgi:hypothetical protein